MVISPYVERRWWHEYAARKNDEEEEHVADSLLYDERCHLPRTTPRPDCVRREGQQQQQGQQQQGQQAQAAGAAINGFANGHAAAEVNAHASH
jgi:hypothetical protein